MFQSFILSPFPELLSFGLFGATLLRVVAGIISARYGYKRVRTDNSVHTFVSWLQILGGIALVIGFYTQIAAIVLFFTTLHMWAIDRKQEGFSVNKSDAYVLLLAIYLSLLLTGAGFFGFDLPL